MFSIKARNTVVPRGITLFLTALIAAGPAVDSFAATQTYTLQTGNFNAEQFLTSSGGFTGVYNNSGTEVGIYANGGSGQDNTTAFQTFSTNGTTSGAARTLQVGDSFSLTMYSANNPFGFVGVYFDDNTSYSSYSNYNTNERTAVVLGSTGDWVIQNNGTSVDTGITHGNSITITITMTVTSSNTFNMAITNNTTATTTTYYDLVMQNAPGATAHIQSFALADQNDNSGDFYVKNGSLTNTGAVSIGGSNLSLVNSGAITDGLAASSTSTVSANTLTKIGTGTMTLTASNSYSGGTVISNGALNIQNNNGLGATTGSVTVSNGATLQLQGGLSIGANALSLNGAGYNTGGALTNVSGNNTYSGSVTLAGAATITSSTNAVTLTGGIGTGGNRITVNGAGDTTISTNGIAGSGGDILKQGAGNLNLNVASSFAGSSSGSNNVFIDQGTVNAAVTGALGTTNGTSSGAVNMGSSVTGGLNSALNISGTGVTIANPVNVRFIQTGGKTISSTAISGSNTYSGAISLADNVTVNAVTGSKLVFSGTISQAAGTLSSTAGTGLVNNAAPTGGFNVSGTNGSGVMINGTAGSGNSGVVEYDAAMTYTGDTVVNTGTLQFGSGGSLTASSIRLGNSGAATLSLASGTGNTLNVTINSRSSTGTKLVTSSNTSGTSTLGGHIALDDNLTIAETNAGGTLAITQARANSSDTATGLDVKGNTLTLTPTGAITVSAGIYNSTGTGSIVVNGAGVVTLTGSNNGYTGSWAVNSGTLAVSGAGTLGSTSTPGTLSVSSATLDVTTTAQTAGTTTLGGSAVIQSTGGGGALTAAGVTVNSTGNSVASGTVISNVTQSAASALTVNGAVTGTDSLGTGASLAGTGSVNGRVNLSNGNTLSSSGALGVTTLNVSGTGNAISSGTVNASGGTTINASSNLTVSGALGGGNVTVSGTLGGTGTVTAAVTVSAGGSTLPGMNGAPAKLTTDLSYNGSTSAQFTLLSTTTADSPRKVTAGTDYDQMIVTGSSNPVLTIGSGGSTIQPSGTSNSNVALQLNLGSNASNVLSTLKTNQTNNYIAGGANSGLDNYFVFKLGTGTSSGYFSTLTITDASGDTLSGVIYYSGANDRFNGTAGLGDAMLSGTLGGVAVSQEFAISYEGDYNSNSTVGGNDIVITAIPEPGTYAMAISGFGILIGLQRIRKRGRK